MKELKYRAHNPNLYNRWIYGSSLYKRTIIEKNQYTLSDFWKMIEQGSFKYNGEYTGLHDKNNTGIYEGDILRSNISNVGFVRHSDSICWYISYNLINNPTLKNPPNENLISQLWDSQDRWEIIGNIYSNPELLKGGEKCST